MSVVITTTRISSLPGACALTAAANTPTRPLCGLAVLAVPAARHRSTAAHATAHRAQHTLASCPISTCQSTRSSPAHLPNTIISQNSIGSASSSGSPGTPMLPAARLQAEGHGRVGDKVSLASLSQLRCFTKLNPWDCVFGSNRKPLAGWRVPLPRVASRAFAGRGLDGSARQPTRLRQGPSRGAAGQRCCTRGWTLQEESADAQGYGVGSEACNKGRGSGKGRDGESGNGEQNLELLLLHRSECVSRQHKMCIGLAITYSRAQTMQHSAGAPTRVHA